MIRNLFVKMGLLLFIVLLMTACANDEPNQPDSPENETPEKEADKEPAESDGEDRAEEPAIEEKEITISAIGDMLIHDTVYEDARTADGSFDFKPMLNRVKPFLNDTTITFANQETMIGGKALGLSSYPTFNSPYAVGDALDNAGVDVVSLANNHTLDGGEDAITNAIEHWEKIDMMYTGAYKNEADRNDLRVYRTDKGISVAFLAYTYGTNGIPVPSGEDYLVNLIDKDNMAKRIKKAKKQADAVVLSLHYGNQYKRMPSDEQKNLVQFAADSGVDVVLGHHPHVLQPVDWIEGRNGNETLVAYSLGNFLSGQDEFYRRIGGIFQFSIHKTIDGDQETTSVRAPKFMPTFVKFRNASDFAVAPMYQLTDEELSNASEHYRDIKQHMSQWMPELSFIEK